MSLRAQRQAFCRLLASPPALRSEVVRFAVLLSQQRSFATRHATPLRDIKPIYRASLSCGRIREETRLAAARRLASTTSTAAETLPPASPTSSSTESGPDPTNPPRSRLSRILTRTLLITFCLTTGFAMSAAPAAETVNGYLNPPSDPETLALFVPQSRSQEEINTHILTHPLAVKLRAQENIVESRPHMKIPPAMRPHNLTGGTLLGEGKIAVPPLNFASVPGEQLPTLTQIVYLGEALCGHPGIVHGGLLATLLDEGLARACFPALPNKVGVTASLKIDYRVPCPAERYVVLKAETTKVEGRKAWVRGWIELLGEDGEGEGTKMVEAEALFVEPKGAKGMARVYSSQ